MSFRIKVKCSVVLTIDLPEVPSDAPPWNEDRIRFLIEENGCPGTGIVGTAFERQVDFQAPGCWACNLEGENELLEIMEG